MKKYLYIISFTIGVAVAITFHHYLGDDEKSMLSKNQLNQEINLPNELLVYTDNGGAELGSVLDGSKKNILIFLSLNCSSCLDQALVWRKLHSDYSNKYAFRLFLFEMGSSKSMDFLNRADLPFLKFEIDEFAIKNLNITVWPKIYITDSIGEIQYITSGQDAAIDLEKYLNSKLFN